MRPSSELMIVERSAKVPVPRTNEPSAASMPRLRGEPAGRRAAPIALPTAKPAAPPAASPAAWVLAHRRPHGLFQLLIQRLGAVSDALAQRCGSRAKKFLVGHRDASGPSVVRLAYLFFKRARFARRERARAIKVSVPISSKTSAPPIVRPAHACPPSSSPMPRVSPSTTKYAATTVAAVAVSASQPRISSRNAPARTPILALSRPTLASSSRSRPIARSSTSARSRASPMSPSCSGLSASHSGSGRFFGRSWSGHDSAQIAHRRSARSRRSLSGGRAGSRAALRRRRRYTMT